jgi:aldose sugar dehydrogenase
MHKPVFFAIGAVTALSCSSFMGTESAPKKVQPANKLQGRVNLTNLYNDTCAKCHGVKGEGGGGGTPSLLTMDKFDQKWDKPFFDATKKGVPDAGMEAYGETMSDAVIWGLVVHIRELQASALRSQFSKSPSQGTENYTSQYHKYRIEEVTKPINGFSTPWSIDWLPDGRMLVTARNGKLAILKNGQVEGMISNLPPSVEMGQGGLMEVAVHPDYARNGWIYLSIADPSKDGGRKSMTKLVRGKLQFGPGGTAEWTNTQTIFETDPDNYTGSGVHFGCKIVFDGRGKIYFSIGERGDQNKAQDLTRPNGKIYRINEDGTIPSDNPFVNERNAIKAIWSYGHRNPQGLTLLPNGELWDTEHAPRGGDELNLVKKAANYGWPVVSFGINYNDSPHATPWADGIAMPAFRWLPSIGASGLDHVRGNGRVISSQVACPVTMWTVFG